MVYGKNFRKPFSKTCEGALDRPISHISALSLLTLYSLLSFSPSRATPSHPEPPRFLSHRSLCSHRSHRHRRTEATAKVRRASLHRSLSNGSNLDLIWLDLDLDLIWLDLDFDLIWSLFFFFFGLIFGICWFSLVNTMIFGNCLFNYIVKHNFTWRKIQI